MLDDINNVRVSSTVAYLRGPAEITGVQFGDEDSYNNTNNNNKNNYIVIYNKFYICRTRA